jgi:uncharacterized protein (TIGR00645 family)
MERIIERLLFASRWLLAPIYLGMGLVLLVLGIEFFHELYEIALGLFAYAPAEAATSAKAMMEAGQERESLLVLKLLSLIDLVLIGSLIVMVMFSGYENFVSRIDTGDEADKLGWLGKLDAGTLKLKVAASIVAISSIHLLEKFMQVQQLTSEKLLWYVIIHMTFVVSALLMGVLDRIAFAAHREH